MIAALAKAMDNRASYRDLLNTAESIIEMNGQMHNVETHMAEIGQKCNTRLLERKATNFRAWQEEVDNPGMTNMMSLLLVVC